jgi:ankyrin repeat protein
MPKNSTKHRTYQTVEALEITENTPPHTPAGTPSQTPRASPVPFQHVERPMTPENLCDKNFCSAIVTAAHEGAIDLLQYLLLDSRSDPAWEDFAAVKASAEQGHKEVTEFLIDFIAKNPETNLAFSENFAFRWAVQNDKPDLVKVLMVHPSINSSFGKHWSISEASRLGYTEITRRLIMESPQDSDLTVRDNIAFRWAVQNNELEVVRFLMDHETIDPSFDFNWAIREASAKGFTEIVLLLLTDERVVVSACDNGSIKLAAQNGWAETVKVLLQNESVDPAATDNYGIRKASQNGHYDVVHVLLHDKRVDPSALDSRAIRNAARAGHTKIVELLLDDVRVNAGANDNEAIREAAQNGHYDVVKALLQDENVDPAAMGNEALNLAGANGHSEVARLLLIDERVMPSNKICDIARKFR